MGEVFVHFLWSGSFNFLEIYPLPWTNIWLKPKLVNWKVRRNFSVLPRSWERYRKFTWKIKKLCGVCYSQHNLKLLVGITCKKLFDLGTTLYLTFSGVGQMSQAPVCGTTDAEVKTCIICIIGTWSKQVNPFSVH